MIEESWVETLVEVFSSASASKKVLHLIGLGNPVRKDDGVGIQIITSLRRRERHLTALEFCKIHSPSFRIESFLSKIDYRGEMCLIVDAIQFNSLPGSVILASLRDTKFGFFATHNVPIRLLPNLAENLDNVFFLGVQPLDLGVGEGLSEPVRDSAKKIVSILTDLIEAKVIKDDLL